MVSRSLLSSSSVTWIFDFAKSLCSMPEAIFTVEPSLMSG